MAVDIFDELVTEWAYRSKTGTPSINNQEDLFLLEDILVEMGIDANTVIGSIKLLSEAPEDSEEKDNWKKGYTHRNFGFYVKDSDVGKDDAQVFKADDEKSRMFPVSQDEYEKVKKERGQGEDSQAADAKGQGEESDAPPAGKLTPSDLDNATRASDDDIFSNDDDVVDQSTKNAQEKKELEKKEFLTGMVDVLVQADPKAGMGAGRYDMSREDLDKYKKYLEGERPKIPNYEIEDSDIDFVIDSIRNKDSKLASSFREKLRKKGDPPKEYRTGDAGSERVNNVLKHYLSTGGRSSITGEVVPFNQSQLDHVVSLDNGGKDEPDNWEYMEARFNQFKGALTDDKVMNKIKKSLSQSPEQLQAKKLKTALKQFTKQAYIKYWDKKFSEDGDLGLTTTNLAKMNGDQLDYLIKGWNNHNPAGTEHYIARYEESEDRASGRAGGGRKISRGERMKRILNTLRETGNDIPTKKEEAEIDGALKDIIEQIAAKNTEIKSLS